MKVKDEGEGEAERAGYELRSTEYSVLPTPHSVLRTESLSLLPSPFCLPSPASRLPN
jgi:hypothetical protein